MELKHAIRKLEQINPDQFEIYFQRKTQTKIDSKNMQVDSLSRAEDVGLAIRVIKDRRMGFSFTTSLTPEAIDRAAESAMEIATLMPEDEFAGLQSFGSFVYPDVDSLDAKGLQAPLQSKIELALALESECRKADQRITAVRAATLSETLIETRMIDSQGEEIRHQSTIYSGNITCKAEQGGDSQIGGEFGFSNYFDNLNVKNIGRLAARWATELLQAGPAPTMLCPAVFRNSVVSELVDFISASFSAEEIDKGRSMLAGKSGQHLFSEHVTLIDDGLYPGGIASSPFDGEGTPTRKTMLVDGGFISGELYDGYYARKLGKESSGNAGRSIKSTPTIGPSNIYLQKGRRTEDQLLDGISKGILITDLMGVHTANPVTGDFSLGASGILIENGKLTRPVRGFAVAGNVLEIFKRITDVGNDLRFFGNVGAPSVRVSEISVGGK